MLRNVPAGLNSPLEDGGAANSTTNQIASVIQTVLAAQLVTKGGLLDQGPAADVEKREKK